MPLLKELYQVVSVIEGMPRHTSIHAAGIIISNQPLDNIIPLLKSSNGIYTTGYSMEYLEELGLLKMDFLGLKNLTLIMNIIDSIKQTEKIEIDFNNIPLDDPKTLDLFNKANTEGIFQFESTGMKNFLSKLKVKHFEDIVVANALFRPGPMANIDSYIKRKFNKEAIDYIHPDLHEILVPTYGIIVYQEQIMQIATIMAGYTLGEADVLRRAMGKKELSLLVNDQAKFISRCLERGYTKEVADKVFSLILKFANYGFNRSHSVAYAHIGYKMAYLKAHYLKHFIVNLLNSVIGSDLKTKKYIYEAKLNNINILKPDINLSNVFYKAEALGIRFSLSSIRNLGLTTCQAIIKERIKGPYRDFIDFILRTYGKSVNVKTIESLIKANCFSAFGYNQKTLLHNLEKIINYVELSRELNADTLEKPQIEIVPEFNKEQFMAHDIEMFGFYLSNHPATKYKATTKVIDIINIANFFNQTIEVIGYIENIKVIKTKKNEDMAFITISDELSTIDLILFPKTYLQYKALKVGNIIKVNGKVERRLANYQLIVNNITIVE